MPSLNRLELHRIVAQSVRDGSAMEVTLARLREVGASKVESIRALVDGTRMSLADAKRTVHFSAVWTDLKERDEKFWDELESGLP